MGRNGAAWVALHAADRAAPQGDPAGGGAGVFDRKPQVLLS